MKQKTESKLTTLARLVAVHNYISQQRYISVYVEYGKNITLVDDANGCIYSGGSLDRAISVVTISLCKCLHAPSTMLHISY